VNSANEREGVQPSAYGWVALVLAGLALQAWFSKNGADLAVFELAGRRALSGQELYRLDEAMPFKYSPAAAFLLSPFALLPHRAAHFVWNALSVLALLRLLRWSCRRASLGQSLVVLALHAPFLHRLFALGQIDALLLWLMVESESRAEGFISGLLWALACLFKPPFLIFLLLALAFRQWRRIAGLAFGLALGLAIDWRELPRWRELLEVTTRPMLCGDPENQGLVGIACHYLGGAIFAIPLAAALLALFAFASAKGGPKLAAASAFFLSAFLSPLCWQTNLLSLIPLAYLLVEAIWRTRSTALGAALTAAVAVNALGYDLLGRDRFFAVLEHRHYGLTALFVALCGAAATALARPVDHPLLQ